MTVSENRSTDNSAEDWQTFVLGANATGLRLIECLAKRRFNSGVLADEAATFVLERLSENEWQRCTQFKGDSQQKTFLQKLIVNLLEEFSRKRFGRPRPPAWLLRQGELWVKLWKQLCLERQPLPALMDRYEQGKLYQGAWVQQVARVIKARIPNCGEVRFEAATVVDIAVVSDASSDDRMDSLGKPQDKTQPEDYCGYDFELQAETELLLVLRAVLQPQPTTESFCAEQAQKMDAKVDASISRKLDKLRQALELSDEETILLRMFYADGLSKTAVSRALGLPAHRAGLMIKNVLDRIRQAVNVCELDLSSLLEQI